MEEPWTTKLARAREHIESLAAEVDDYLATQPARLDVIEPTVEQPAYQLRIRVDREPPPRWSAVVGDVIHNARSALDSFGYHLVTQSSPTRLSEKQLRQVSFPIATTEQQFASWNWHAGVVSTETRRVVRSVQPFAQVEGLDLPAGEAEAAVANDPLTVLHRLWNVDKHRTLHPTLCALDLAYVGLPKGASSEWRPADPPPWGDGSVVMRVVLSELPAGRAPEFGDSFAVALAEDVEPLFVAPMIDRLRAFTGAVESALFAVGQSLS
jgi:hypothetical protein